MDKQTSFSELALQGVGRMREKNNDLRGRVAALLLLLRGTYFTGAGKYRAFAEEDLRAIWRGGVHDHIGGGFFCAAPDREWLRPVFEKRLDGNAVLAFLYAEAWESGRMGFYRDAAEEALDFCLRELPAPSGLFCAGVCLSPEAPENPFLFTPAQIADVLGAEAGRPFAECYDVTDEPNCGEGSIPNLILNERWNLLPAGYDDLRERLRLWRAERGGVETDPRAPLFANALLLAALAKAGRVFADRRYLAAAEELSAALAEREGTQTERAALLFALTELYAADYDPAHLAAALRCAGAAEALVVAPAPSPEGDLALSLAALGYDALLRLTGEESWRARRGAVLRELCLRPERHGPESLGGVCALLASSHTQRRVLCVTPEELRPSALCALTGRYAPDLTILVKTPANAAALAEVCPWTAAFPIGEKTLLYPFADGQMGSVTGI
ncbi:MAG: thioredoxin domain-containing protein [Oscillospiraceae bacterium]|nr:thioredoxin domain-containing protein [Oscillospiraceae bacterium]